MIMELDFEIFDPFSFFFCCVGCYVGTYQLSVSCGHFLVAFPQSPPPFQRLHLRIFQRWCNFIHYFVTVPRFWATASTSEHLPPSNNKKMSISKRIKRKKKGFFDQEYLEMIWKRQGGLGTIKNRWEIIFLFDSRVNNDARKTTWCVSPLFQQETGYTKKKRKRERNRETEREFFNYSRAGVSLVRFHRTITDNQQQQQQLTCGRGCGVTFRR